MMMMMKQKKMNSSPRLSLQRDVIEHVSIQEVEFSDAFMESWHLFKVVGLVLEKRKGGHWLVRTFVCLFGTDLSQDKVSDLVVDEAAL